MTEFIIKLIDDANAANTEVSTPPKSTNKYKSIASPVV